MSLAFTRFIKMLNYLTNQQNAAFDKYQVVLFQRKG